MVVRLQKGLLVVTVAQCASFSSKDKSNRSHLDYVLWSPIHFPRQARRTLLAGQMEGNSPEVCKRWGWATFGAKTQGEGAGGATQPSPLPLLVLLPAHLQLPTCPSTRASRPICVIAGAATSTQRLHHGHAHHVPSHLGVLPLAQCDWPRDSPSQ